MSEALSMSGPMTLAVSPNVISSQALALGHTHYVLLDGQMTDLFGQALAPASHSPSPEKAMASQTSATCGPHGSNSSASADLSLSLASRLQAKTRSLGSTLFRLTWKVRVTPSGRLIPALRGTAHRISGNVCTSWPTTTVQDSVRMPGADFATPNITLNHAASYAHWPTPNTPSGGRSMDPSKMSVTGKTLDGRKHTVSLEHVVRFASWPTPRNEDSESTGAHRGKPDTLHSATQLAHWITPQTHDDKERGNTMADHHYSPHDLSNQSLLATWATPSTRDWKDSPGMATTGIDPDGTERTRLDQLPRQAQLTDSGATPNGSPAGTEKRGQLNPALSRWLMGLPRAWDDCAPEPLRRRKAK